MERTKRKDQIERNVTEACFFAINGAGENSKRRKGGRKKRKKENFQPPPRFLFDLLTERFAVSSPVPTSKMVDKFIHQPLISTKFE